MPAIPIYEQRTRAEGPLGGAPVRPDSNGLGEGLQALAQGVQAYQRDMDVIKQRDAAAAAGTALSSLREQTIQQFNDAQANAAEDASNFTPGVMKSFEEASTKTLATAQTPQARRMMQEQIQEMHTHLFGQATNFQANARQVQRAASVDQSIDRLRVAVEADPESWKSAGAEQMHVIDAIGLEPAARMAAKQKLDLALTEAAATGLAKRDPLKAIADLKTDKSGDPRFDGLTLEARHRVEAIAKDQFVTDKAANIVATYANKGQSAGIAALGQLEKSGLDPALMNEVRGHVNEGVSQLRNERLQQHAGVLTDVEKAIANGTATQATHAKIQNLYAIGALTPIQQASYEAQIDRSITSNAANTAAADTLKDALNSGLPLDPHNKEHRDALAAAFHQDTLNVPVGSPAWQTSAQAWADKTRMLPDQALAWTRQAMRSPDARIAASAAQFLGSITATAPDAMSQVDTDTKAFAGTVNGMIEAGAAPGAAVETGRMTVFDLKPEVVKRRQEEYSALIKGGQGAPHGGSDSALAKYIGDDFGHFFRADPAANADLKSDFESQAGRYYAKTGDAKLAQDLAWADLKRVYGVTKVNGTEQMIAFPPERFGVSPADVKQDVGDFLKTHPQADGSTADDVMLVPDALTLRQVADALSGQPVAPSYKLVTKSGDVVVRDNGIRKRFTLPGGEALAQRLREQQAKAYNEAAASVQAAKDKRDNLRRLEEFRRTAVME